MKRLLFVLCLAAGISSLSAAPLKPLALTAADNGKTHTVKAGQAIVLSLKGNITTGYGWDVDKVDGTSVAPVGEIKYRSDAQPEGMVGGGGVFEAKFKARQPGKTTIKLKYCRPWEKDTAPAETFTVTLVVER